MYTVYFVILHVIVQTNHLSEPHLVLISGMIGVLRCVHQRRLPSYACAKSHATCNARSKYSNSCNHHQGTRCRQISFKIEKSIVIMPAVYTEACNVGGIYLRRLIGGWATHLQTTKNVAAVPSRFELGVQFDRRPGN